MKIELGDIKGISVVLGHGMFTPIISHVFI